MAHFLSSALHKALSTTYAPQGSRALYATAHGALVFFIVSSRLYVSSRLLLLLFFVYYASGGSPPGIIRSYHRLRPSGSLHNEHHTALINRPPGSNSQSTLQLGFTWASGITPCYARFCSFQWCVLAYNRRCRHRRTLERRGYGIWYYLIKENY